MEEFELTSVSQAKRYKRLLNQFRQEARDAQAGISEGEVLYRMQTLESIMVLLGNDATALVMDWESDQRQGELHDFTTG